MGSKDRTSSDKPRVPAAAIPAADPTASGVTRNNSGRVKFDDRGNAIWEWALNTGSFGADVSTSRLKKLENTTLALADDVPTPVGAAKPNVKGTAHGYSPYDSGLLARKEAPRKKTDLKRLSEYYKLRQQASRNKRDDEEPV